MADVDAVKAALYTHGALFTSYIHANDALDTTVPEKSHYYYPDALAGRIAENGHGVTLVGWDDNYPKADLAVNINGQNYEPPGNGAYIIKNSWGANWGDDGFFYVSYYSHNFPGANFAYFVLESNEDYNTIYQYDLLGMVYALPLSDSHAYMKNTFTATSNEALRGIGFYTTDLNQIYDVFIETDGEQKHVAGGTMAEMGYHTLRLPEEIPLRTGQDFSVIVRVETADGSASRFPWRRKFRA